MRPRPTKEDIATLQRDGYTVVMIYDGDPPLYAWAHDTSPARQSLYKERQPYRRTQLQAWDDCRAYCSGDMPMQPNPDWTD